MAKQKEVGHKIVTVQELINELMQIQDKSKEMEIPSHGTFEEFTAVSLIEETKHFVRLVG